MCVCVCVCVCVTLSVFCCSLHHVKRPGAILHPGMLVARIDLDDPSHVQQAEKFQGPLPSAPQTMESQKAKVHQVYNVYKTVAPPESVCLSLPSPYPQRFQQAETILQYVMAGFAVQEPFFSQSLGSAASTFLKALTDPALPLMEMQVYSATAGWVCSMYAHTCTYTCIYMYM